MRTTLLAALLTLAAAIPAAADTADKIEAMPYAKAAAYAQAIDEFCFADRVYATQELAVAALNQSTSALHMGFDVFDTRVAEAQLKVDHAACGPAEAFVAKVAAQLPDAHFDELLALAASEERVAEAVRQAAATWFTAEIEAGRRHDCEVTANRGRALITDDRSDPVLRQHLGECIALGRLVGEAALLKALVAAEQARTVASDKAEAERKAASDKAEAERKARTLSLVCAPGGPGPHGSVYSSIDYVDGLVTVTEHGQGHSLAREPVRPVSVKTSGGTTTVRTDRYGTVIFGKTSGSVDGFSCDLVLQEASQ